MDGSRFDQLSRRVASFGTRRQAIRAFAGAVAAIAAGGRATVEAQQACRPRYSSCSSDGACCAGAVCQSGMCMPGCRIDGIFRSASTPAPGNTCASCRPELSTTSWSAANEGINCWSGSANLCGGPSTCRSGVCTASSSVTCQPLTVCHEAGECNPSTGLCSHPPAAAGKVCGGGEMCFGGYYSPPLTCNGSGACTGGATVPCAPYTCDGPRCRTSCDNDSHCASGAFCCDGSCVYLGSVDHCGACGDRCEDADTCTPARCDAGVCNQETNCGPVDSCTPARCENGVCNTATNCPPADTCTPAGCDQGVCREVTGCPPADTCTPGRCDGGVCNAVTDCQAVDTCTPGRCDGGVCNAVTDCQPVDTCTPAQCDGGVCNAATSCQPVDACTPAECSGGVCNDVTSCQAVDTCTPARCEGGTCNAVSDCQPFDGCTPAACVGDACNAVTACEPADLCTPGRCEGTVCNAVSDCTGFDTCGGGGVPGSCGCTPSVCVASCAENGGCGGLCAGQPENNPVAVLRFEPTGVAHQCQSVIEISGFTGCTTPFAFIFRGPNPPGNPLIQSAIIDVPTDTSGSGTSTGPTYADNEGYYAQVVINGVVESGWQWLECSSAT